MTRPPLKNKRAIFSWCLFDFGNSAFTTVIITAVFNLYFVNEIAVEDGPRLWNIGLLASNLLVLVSAPVVGAIADYGGKRKGFLLASFLICIGFTAALSALGEGQVALALFLVVIANTAFASGENLVAAFLPDLAEPDDIARISAWGWGIGYVGGLAALGLCLFAMNHWGTEYGARMCGLIVAVFFLIGGLPTFLFVTEKKRDGMPLGEAIGRGMREAANTVQDRQRLPDLFTLFMGALVLQIGIYGVIQNAGIYGDKLAGMDQPDVTKALLAAQITAFLGAIFSGRLAGTIGAVSTIRMTVLIWLAAGFLLLFNSSPVGFWTAALVAGFAMGASLATIRAAVALFTPEGRGGEIFGFWGLFGRLAAILAPAGNVVLLSTTNGRQEAGITYFIGCFVLSWFLLKRVDERRGRSAATNQPSN